MISGLTFTHYDKCGSVTTDLVDVTITKATVLDQKNHRENQPTLVFADILVFDTL